jgi:chaperonin GroEL (HSP60 family)
MEGDEKIGVDIVKRACEEPLRQIAGNAGWEGAVVVEKIRSESNLNFGFNAETEVYEDLVKSASSIRQRCAVRPSKSSIHRLAHAHHRGYG